MAISKPLGVACPRSPLNSIPLVILISPVDIKCITLTLKINYPNYIPLIDFQFHSLAFKVTVGSRAVNYN